MERAIRHFKRERDGGWICVSHVEIATTLGRVEVAAGSRFAPGTNYMGVDIVELLEEEFRKINGLTREILLPVCGSAQS